MKKTSEPKEDPKTAALAPQTEVEKVVKAPKPEKITPEPCECEGLGI